MKILVCYIIKQMHEWASSAHLRMRSSKLGRRVTENRNTSTMRSFKIFSRWRHFLFSISQFNSRNPNPNPNPNPKPNPNPNPNPNPKPNPNPNPKPNPNEMFEIRQSFNHPF